jgi:redox-sensitive bicupin YhaK (pirin superfamily)
LRKIKRISKSVPTLEGAGVHLHRAFANNEAHLFDPFLLLDDFRSDNPAQFLQGFPWHPHRGMETITYVLQGNVEHGDSLGNKGNISCGDVQWMTAGSGIVHQEMPNADEAGHMGGFQLWANLPAKDKMMQPRYRDIKAAQIPTVTYANGIEIKVICGQVGEEVGPVTDVLIEPEYLDVYVPSGKTFKHPTSEEHTVFAYVYGGCGVFEENSAAEMSDKSLILFEKGDCVAITAGKENFRFLLISGRPLKESIAWGGPIVMNTYEELQLAFDEFKNGTFLKHMSNL